MGSPTDIITVAATQAISTTQYINVQEAEWGQVMTTSAYAGGIISVYTAPTESAIDSEWCLSPETIDIGAAESFLLHSYIAGAKHLKLVCADASSTLFVSLQ